VAKDPELKLSSHAVIETGASQKFLERMADPAPHLL
jgi:hypothetical protein